MSSNADNTLEVITLLSMDYTQNMNNLNALLGVKRNFDIVAKPMKIGGMSATLYFVDGFAKDEVMEKIMEFLLDIKPEALASIQHAQQFAEQYISYLEADVVADTEQIVTDILSGSLALLVEGFGEIIIIDARTYPARSVAEPDDDKVLRGSRDGFVETLIFNTALIRRRIRDPGLTMRIFSIGDRSKTDVVLCYMEGLVDEKVLNTMVRKLENIHIHALTMGQESLAECLIQSQWYNPFPRVRYTERPDVAAANVLEGKLMLIVDNSPAVMILPTSLFDYVQETNEFYFPPLIGTYLRFVRLIIFSLTLFLTPLWYFLLKNPAYIPQWLQFIKVGEPNSVPIFLQLIIMEFAIDMLKLASLNTPSVLSSSFGVVGALILGDFAVKARWLVPEVVLYMSFVAIAGFTQPSFELGYTFKLFRMLLLTLIVLFNFWGFVAGIVCIGVLAATTKTVTGRCYLFPLVPFNKSALVRVFIRKPISNENN